MGVVPSLFIWKALLEELPVGTGGKDGPLPLLPPPVMPEPLPGKPGMEGSALAAKAQSTHRAMLKTDFLILLYFYF